MRETKREKERGRGRGKSNGEAGEKGETRVNDKSR